MKLTLTHKLIFILAFGPALVFYVIGFFVTACRISWGFGRDAAVQHLAETLAERRVRK